nr:hypothetical protein [Tanacetum cinerariifolium]
MPVAVSIVSCGTHHILHKKYCLFFEDNQIGSLVYMPILVSVLLVDKLLAPLLHLVEVDSLCWILHHLQLLGMRALHRVGHPIVEDIHQESLAGFVQVFLYDKGLSTTSVIIILITFLLRFIQDCYLSWDGSPSVDHFSPDLCFDHLGLLDLLTLFKASSSRILASFKQSSQKHTASIKDARPSGSHFFNSLSNCSLKILLGSSKTCIFPSDLFMRSLPLMEKLLSLLAKLDIESSRWQWLKAEDKDGNVVVRYKGKEIAKLLTPPSESASKEESDPEQAQRDKDIQKNLTLIQKYFKKIYKLTNNNLRTSSNSRNKNVDTSARYKNDNQTGQFRNQRTVNVAEAKETIGSQEKMLCKQAEKGVPLQAEQADWLEDTNKEINEQELEAHYSYVAKIQEVLPADIGIDVEPLEKTNQNAKESNDERDVLANLIANLTLDTT